MPTQINPEVKKMNKDKSILADFHSFKMQKRLAGFRLQAEIIVYIFGYSHMNQVYQMLH